MTAVRPMREDDIAAVDEVKFLAFGETAPLSDVQRERSAVRLRHLLHSDPGGAWVAEHDGAIAGCSMALVREGVWGLSLLVVRPDLQSVGIGRELLARAHDYANGARGRIVVASSDPRALRAYARLGLDLHPAIAAHGVPRGVVEPRGVRAGTLADVPFTEAVDRRVRGAAHGADIAAFLQGGAKMIVAPERAYALIRDGEVVMLAGMDEAGARAVLRAALARAGREPIEVGWLTASQGWAIEECVEAGLELRSGAGAVFLGGDVGPFRPYIPSGAYL